MDLSGEEKYMRRALTLARHGIADASPNPMVGAVIVAGGRIIGEGFHRRCGEGHAEVNAIASVAEDDRPLLGEATIYVTLEPCSHYGKTPPCAQLIIDTGIPRVVVGCADPFPKVSGRGISMLRDSGVEVVTGMLEDECRALNERFMTAHTHGRPYILLKWAQSADGFIGGYDSEGRRIPAELSDALGLQMVHRLRARHDAIMVGTDTVISDNPSLTTRRWPGHSPRPVTVDRLGRIPQDAVILRDPRTVVFTRGESIEEMMRVLYEDYGVTSLMVEGGTRLLASFIEAGLWDAIRRERAPRRLREGTAAPQLPKEAVLTDCQNIRGHLIEYFRR